MITPPNDQEIAAAAAAAAAADGNLPIGRESALQNIKTIREILVGDQIHNLNDRFHNLEKSLEAHYSKLVNQLMAKFEAVQTLSKSEVDELGKTISEKVSHLQKEDAVLTEEIKISMKRIADLENRVDEMKSGLSEQVRKMYEEFSKQMSEFSRLVKNQHDEMARQVVSRKDLAKIMNGLADSLVPENVDQKKS